MSRPSDEWIPLLFEGPKPPERVLFRVDAGRVWGLSFGHLARCKILACFLRDCWRARCVFAMKDHPDGVGHARASGWEVQTLPADLQGEEDRRTTLRLAANLDADWIVLDLPYDYVTEAHVEAHAHGNVPVLFLDSGRRLRPAVDVVLDSSILAWSRPDGEGTGPGRLFLGPEYFPFDEDALVETPPRRDGFRNVLVTLGGSDPAGLTGRIVRALVREAWPGAWIRVVLGPGYDDRRSVRRAVERAPSPIEVLDAPPSLVPFLQGCDAAVCAGGRTLYELDHLGKNILAVASNEREAGEIEAFRTAGRIHSGLTAWREEAFVAAFREILAA